MRFWRRLFFGALAGLALFAAGTAISFMLARSQPPSFLPAPLVFWYFSGYPIQKIAYEVLGPNNGFARFGGLVCGLAMWVAAGMAVAAFIRRKSGDGIPREDTAEREAAARTRRPHRWLVVLVPVAVGLFWPQRIPVSGKITVRIVGPDGNVYVGWPVRESWYVEGYGERGGRETARTNEDGAVTFSSRDVWGWAGCRKVKRFLAETSVTPTARWGPYLQIAVEMPEGYWIPYDHRDPIPEDMMVTYQDLGGARYLTVMNVDPKRPDAFITSREPGAFLGEQTLVLNLRRATPGEARTLDESKRRKDLLIERMKRRR